VFSPFLLRMDDDMRLDKYLKVSRLIKRRTIAKEISDAGRIMVNNRQAKSSSKLEIGDILTINHRGKILKVKVLHFKDTTKKEDAKFMYEVLQEEN